MENENATHRLSPARLPSGWRYERKFRLENIPPYLIRQIVRNHPAGFCTVFPDRWVHNLYLDDFNLTALYENFSGAAHRQKMRLRWYGEAFPVGVHPARLEWKIRSNQLGSKMALDLPGLSFASTEALFDQIRFHQPSAAALYPVLLNRYRRSYYATANGLIRLTLDWDISFAEPRTAFQNKRFQFTMPGGILELKYPAEVETQAEWIMQHLPFRMGKSSKYVAGLLAIRGGGK